ncbi:uncharacterized protein LOC119080151 [Bradysia coprophila]|uniref:uncharacterized protein LOC119080151 n=1 Tax=Bradysia coprophila TaxID=38358 RepID=UPI00187D8B7D|nr:uncharacterized protein LOC119080151 [Bradysia coprophila]
MIGKRVSVFVFFWFFGVQVNYVLTNIVPPSQIEPMPDVYSHITYPAANNVVNYNASPNPQYTSPNFNHFNEQIGQPSPQVLGNYQKREYQDYQQKPLQQKRSSDEMVMGANPTTASYDYSSDLKSTIVSVNDNLGLMADTQRLLLNSFKVQQQQYNSIEQKLNDVPFQRNSAYSGQQNYGPTATQQPQYQYQLISPPSPPPLPPLPYGQSPQKEHPVHHHKKAESSKKLLAKLFKKHKKGNRRGLALLQRRSESERLERHAAMTLTYIRNGIVNALWTAAVVACVKLAPILLFGFKLMFKSVLPLTGLALFGTNRGLFPKALKKDDDDDEDVRFDDDEEDDEDDDEEEEDRDVTEEKEESGHHYR